MAHKTLINGTAYEISGGKTLVGGTAYGIKNGKTLVGGTAYEVGFDDGMRTVTVNQVNTACAELGNIPGQGSSASSGTYEVPVGTELDCWVMCDGSGNAKVVLNGVEVYSTSSMGSYYHTVTKNTTVTVDTVNDNGVITITEE